MGHSMASIVTKAQLHELVSQLFESELTAAQRFLKYLLDAGSDPVLRALANAPIDDELETPEEAAAVREAKQDLAAGRIKSLDDVRQELGL